MSPQRNDRRIGPRDEQGLVRYEKYRAVSLLAVSSLVFGLVSVLTIFSWYLSVLPVLGIALGVLALRRIGRLPEEASGAGAAWAGMALSLVLWMVGGGILAFSQIGEAPARYQRISFKTLQPDPDVKGQVIPPKAYERQGGLVYIKGFMYPGRQSLGIKCFILVPTRGHCNFCSRRLKSTDMILVTMAGDLTIDYRASLVGLGGKLRIDPAQAVHRFGGLPYRLEADYVR